MVVTEEMVRSMRPGAVIVDVAVDQGGCIATTRETTHSEPTFVAHDVVHYAVGNMPGAVPHTSTYALTNATLGYLLTVAVSGADRAIATNAHLARGLNTAAGQITNRAVAEFLGTSHTDPIAALGAPGAHRARDGC